ncbi:hypothetical protein V6932_002691 [Vibrio alginolyticus]
MSGIILLTICGVASDFDIWEGVCDFGENRALLDDFENGVLSSSTKARIKVHRGRKWLINCVKDCHEITDCEVVTIGGLAAWGCHNKLEECSAMHVTNVFVIAQVLCLNSRKLMARRMSHGNFKLLEFLNISGYLVPNGAKGYQKK